MQFATIIVHCSSVPVRTNTSIYEYYRALAFSASIDPLAFIVPLGIVIVEAVIIVIAIIAVCNALAR